MDISVTIFALSLVLAFVVSLVGRRHEARNAGGEGLAGYKLNKWFVGLSAGAAANSGFIVTGAVGMGYSQGLRWAAIGLAWMCGDCLFWLLFPERINRKGAAAKASTLTDIIVDRIEPRWARGIKLLVGVIIMLCLSGYVSAQWLSGQKFLSGAFGFESLTSLLIFAALIIVYTAIGGFRGSVYADSMQAIIRIFGTLIAIGAVGYAASQNMDVFRQRIAAAGPDFISLLPHKGVFEGLAFLLGFTAAGVGFDLGSPQLVTRYLAGSSPKETKGAWWIFIGFVQFTWLAMVMFGFMLRGVMPDLPDPERGLSTFFHNDVNPFLTGFISADIFATIAATSNSLLVVMAQTVIFDLLGRHDSKGHKALLWPFVAVIGAVTMGLSLATGSNVVSLALGSISLIGAGLAPAMMAQLLDWRRSGLSLCLCILSGIGVALAWKLGGLSGIANEALPGILTGLAVNYAVARVTAKKNLPLVYGRDAKT